HDGGRRRSDELAERGTARVTGEQRAALQPRRELGRTPCRFGGPGRAVRVLGLVPEDRTGAGGRDRAPGAAFAAPPRATPICHRRACCPVRAATGSLGRVVPR